MIKNLTTANPGWLAEFKLRDETWAYSGECDYHVVAAWVITRHWEHVDGAGDPIPYVDGVIPQWSGTGEVAECSRADDFVQFIYCRECAVAGLCHTHSD